MKYPVLILLLISQCLFLPVVMAADETDAARSEASFPQPHQTYFFLGDHAAINTPGELENPVADFALGLGLAYSPQDYLDLRFDILIVGTEYDTPASVSGGPFTLVSDDMTLTTFGFSLMPLLKQSVADMEFYAGAGLGLFLSKLILRASTFGLYGTHEERSQDIGFQLVAGAGVQLSTAFIAVEFRRLNLKANLAPVTSSGNYDIGGDMLLFIYRLGF
ncbi:MAG: hypothetical protein OEY61_08945 [Gammaproteobacteria bacterium]|nr:hypothetical protein [Gammaproteobacteria bacterium]